MRYFFLAAVLSLGAAPAAAQTVRCQLEDWRGWGYGLAGTCVLEGEAAPGADATRTNRTRFWPREKVSIFIAGGPKTEPPWRGTFQYPDYGESFEIVRQQISSDNVRLVLRTTESGWLTIQDWRELSGIRCGGDKSICEAAELVFRLNYTSAASDDVEILTSALVRLPSIRAWDREDDRDCANDKPEHVSLFCLLSTAIEERMGRYHHSQPALEVVRAVINERYRERLRGHALMDFNNHTATTLQDLRAVLELSLARARAEAASGR